MTWGAVGGAVIGGVIAGQGARSAARTQAGAADRQIAMQREMQQQAMEAARFRPVGVTSPFGQANIQVSDGQLQSVGFELSPELQARAGMFGQLGQETLGRLSADPMQAARERTARLQELQAPGRALEQERLFSNLAAKGLTGLATDVGMGGAVNPYALAQSQAFTEQDAATAAQSLDVARQQQAEDLRMAQAYFGGQQGLFDLGQQQLGTALDLADIERQRAISAATGQANFGTNISNIIGQQANARAQQQAALYGGIGQSISNMDLSGLFNRADPGFRFYNAPASTASSFPLTSAAGQYANNFNYTLPPAQSTQTAFAVPNYAPPSFAPSQGAPRMFGTGANQSFPISP